MGTINEDSIVRLGTSIAQSPPSDLQQPAPPPVMPNPIPGAPAPLPGTTPFPPINPAVVSAPPPLNPGQQPVSPVQPSSPFQPPSPVTPTFSPPVLTPIPTAQPANQTPVTLQPLTLGDRQAAATPNSAPPTTAPTLTLSGAVLLEINALLLTLKYLTEPVNQDKDKKKGFVDEGAFKLTSAFMKGCKEAKLDSEATQKLLDELLNTAQEQQPSEPTGLPRQFDPISVIAVSIQRKLQIKI